jgi:hypothetical protein
MRPGPIFIGSGLLFFGPIFHLRLRVSEGAPATGFSLPINVLLKYLGLERLRDLPAKQSLIATKWN